MEYDFSTRVDRKNTGSSKWKQMYGWNPNVEEGVLPLSVADMELKNAPEIYEGLINFLKHEPILGYTEAPDDYLQAVVDWQAKRHHWKISPEWIVTTPGVVAAFNAAIRAFSDVDDGVIIFSPVYYPFSMTIGGNKRKIVDIPLIEEDGYYTIDFIEFEKAAAKAENKILLFCSPHNPVGRVWTKEELTKIAEIAVKHDLLVISDEIWYDFVRQDKEHTVLHRINNTLQDRLITCTAASKTFNLAGAATSNIIISNKKLRENFIEVAGQSNLLTINIFGFEATRIAYTQAESWLNQLLDLIYSNQKMVKEFFEENYPKITTQVSEGTYLQWLNFKALDMTDEELEAFLHESQFFTDEGYIFGENGSGYERINVALPQEALKELLERLLKALETREIQ